MLQGVTQRQERLLAWVLPWAALMLAAGILLGRMANAALPGWIALGCALMTVILCRGWGRFMAAGLTVCALGFVLGQAAYHPALPAEGTYTVSGIVTGEIRYGDRGQVKTELHHVTLNGVKADNAYWSFYLAEEEALPEGLKPGVMVTMTADVYHPDGADNPDGYDFREYLLQRKMTFGVYGRDDLTCTAAPFTLDGAAAALRHRLSQGLVSAMGEDAGGYASAMLLGVTSLVPSEDREAFSRLGIAHVLSISGFHVGVLAMLIGLLFQALKLSRRLQCGFVGVILAAYCLLTGAHAPVVRAAVLFLLREYGALRHRQRSSLHLLCASMIGILLVSPCQVTGASFQLTYGAMLGLTLVTPAMQRLWKPRNKVLQKLWELTCATMGAQIGVLVPQLYWFGELPLLGLVLNLFVFSLTTGVMALYWLTLVLLPIPALAGAVGSLAGWVTTLLTGAVRTLGSLNCISLWTKQANMLTLIGWCLLMVAISYLAVLHGRKRLLCGITGGALMILALIPLPHTTTEYIQFSVGNADAALLYDQEKVVLIDTGESGYDASRYLHHRRLSVDALILTHLHTDHAGGVEALLADRIPVTTCYVPWGGDTLAVSEDMTALMQRLEATGTQIVTLSRGDVIDLPSGKITVLWPEEGRVRPAMDPNSYSMTMLAEVQGVTLMLTGDLDGAYEMYAATPADVLKAAHHGSVNSSSEAFLAAVQPQTVLISTGRKDRLERMQEKAGDSDVFSTAQHGALTIRMDAGAYTIETFK